MNAHELEPMIRKPGEATHRLLMCNPLRMAYDFNARKGTLWMEDGDCCDMDGAIGVFSTLDQGVTLIETYSGDAQDTSYVRCADGEWQALSHHNGSYETAMRTALCIGGPHDGMVMSAEGRELLVPVRIPIDTAQWQVPQDAATSPAKHKIERYAYEQITSAGERPVAIWRHAGLTMRQALIQLMQVYADEVGVKQQKVE